MEILKNMSQCDECYIGFDVITQRPTDLYTFMHNSKIFDTVTEILFCHEFLLFDLSQCGPSVHVVLSYLFMYYHHHNASIIKVHSCNLNVNINYFIASHCVQITC